MKPNTVKALREYFTQCTRRVFWPSDLSNLLTEHRLKWKDRDLKPTRMLEFLLEEGILKRADFVSRQYPPIVRYVCGEPSPYELAISLRRGSFLSHRTALVLHGLQVPSTRIYVNQEQTPKSISEGITQERIDLAFRRKQRYSQYVLGHRGWTYVLISGKNTGRSGIIRRPSGPNDEAVEVTDFERTLIDIVVRPAYAGGIERVSSAYQVAANRVNLDHLLDLLEKFQYLYPYHQAIGFLLERSGRPANDCEMLMKLGTKYDFYLDYEMEQPAYDKKWRIFHPLLGRVKG
jgi:predicted transcriptional regulator of viral defense system